jgi:hypothetical protein
MRSVAIVLSVLLCAVRWGASAPAEPVPTAESLFGAKDEPNSPVALAVTLKSADSKDGVCVRTEVLNRGKEPYKLAVCPAMLMCCVRGLHPMIAFDQSGMSLLDLCKEKKPTPREVFLPATASFAFDLRIPVDRLPEMCRQAGKKFYVLASFELGEMKFVHSNVVEVELK